MHSRKVPKSVERPENKSALGRWQRSCSVARGVDLTRDILVNMWVKSPLRYLLPFAIQSCYKKFSFFSDHPVQTYKLQTTTFYEKGQNSAGWWIRTLNTRVILAGNIHTDMMIRVFLIMMSVCGSYKTPKRMYSDKFSRPQTTYPSCECWVASQWHPLPRGPCPRPGLALVSPFCVRLLTSQAGPRDHSQMLLGMPYFCAMNNSFPYIFRN